LAFSDGSELEADVVIFCTGFEGNMRLMVAEIVGEEGADKPEDYWLLDKEGEVRGAWKPIGREKFVTLVVLVAFGDGDCGFYANHYLLADPGIWYHGGTYNRVGTLRVAVFGIADKG
jgi:hypothetical protein